MPHLKIQKPLILRAAQLLYYSAISLLFLIFRLHNISRDLHFDEMASVAVSQKNFLSIVLGRYGDLGDMPMYYLMIKTFTLFSNSEIAVRAVSVISGVLTLYIFFRISLALFEKKMSTVIAMLVFSSSSILLFYQQSARSYALSTCIQLLFVLLMIVSKKWKYLSSITALIGTLFLTVFSSFSSLYFFLILPIVWIMDKRLKKASILSLILLVALVFSWHIQYRSSPEYSEALQNYFSKDTSISASLGDLASTQYIFYPNWAGSIELSASEESLSNTLYTFSSFIFFFGLGIIFFDVESHRRKPSRRNINIVAITLALFLLIPIFFSLLSFNITQLRMHLLVVPLLILLLISVLEGSRSVAVRFVAAFCLIFFLCTNVLSTYLSLKIRPHRISEIIHSVQAVAEHKSTVCIASHGTAVHYFSYYLQEHFKCKTIPLTFSNEKKYSVEKKLLNEHLLSRSTERVVLLEYYSDRDEEIFSLLEKNGFIQESTYFPNAVVSASIFRRKQ